MKQYFYILYTKYHTKINFTKTNKIIELDNQTSLSLVSKSCLFSLKIKWKMYELNFHLHLNIKFSLIGIKNLLV